MGLEMSLSGRGWNWKAEFHPSSEGVKSIPFIWYSGGLFLIPLIGRMRQEDFENQDFGDM